MYLPFMGLSLPWSKFTKIHKKYLRLCHSWVNINRQRSERDIEKNARMCLGHAHGACGCGRVVGRKWRDGEMHFWSDRSTLSFVRSIDRRFCGRWVTGRLDRWGTSERLDSGLGVKKRRHLSFFLSFQAANREKWNSTIFYLIIIIIITIMSFT